MDRQKKCFHHRKPNIPELWWMPLSIWVSIRMTLLTLDIYQAWKQASKAKLQFLLIKTGVQFKNWRAVFCCAFLSHPAIWSASFAIGQVFLVNQFLGHPAFCLEKFFGRSSFCFHIFWNFLIFSLSEIKNEAINISRNAETIVHYLAGIASGNNNYQNYFFVEQCT